MLCRKFYVSGVALLFASSLIANIPFNPYDKEIQSNRDEILKGYAVMNQQLKTISKWGPFMCKKPTAPKDSEIPYLVTFSLRENKDAKRFGKKFTRRWGVVNFYKINVKDASFINCTKNQKGNPGTAEAFMEYLYKVNEKKQPYFDIEKKPETFDNRDGILMQAHSKDPNDPYYFADILYGKYHVKLSVTVDEWVEGKPKVAYINILPNPALGEIAKRQTRIRGAERIRLAEFNFDARKLFHSTADKYEVDVEFITTKENEYAKLTLENIIKYYKGNKASYGPLNDQPLYYSLINASEEFSYYKPGDRRAIYSLFDKIPNSKFIEETVREKARKLLVEYAKDLKGLKDIKDFADLKKRFPKFSINLHEKTERDDLKYLLLADGRGKVFGAIAVYLYYDTEWFGDNHDSDKGPWYYNEERECWYAVGALIDSKEKDGTLKSEGWRIVDQRCVSY